MLWLIVEDSLQTAFGHWFELLQDFHHDLPRFGDKAAFLVSYRAESLIKERLGALALLPEGAALKVSDGASVLTRYWRIPAHGWATFWAVRKYFRSCDCFDVVFVPTVSVHHLLPWALLSKLHFRALKGKLLLFFWGLPIRSTGSQVSLDGSPSARLMLALFRWLRSDVRSGRIILGVETEAMKRAAEEVFKIPFTYFAQPVQFAKAPAVTFVPRTSKMITMACYGLARYEKGSDLFVSAIEKYFAKFPNRRVRFVLQWCDDFRLPSGETARLPASFKESPDVEIIRHVFADGELARRLSATDVMVLPYRCSSYRLRGSRVVIEAMAQGLPVVVTRGTTLAQQAEKYGASILCEDENVESLVAAIDQMERNYEQLSGQAVERRQEVREHFSVSRFRETLLGV